LLSPYRRSLLAWTRLFQQAVTFSCDHWRMTREGFDYQREAHAAMRMAVGACGFERLEWVRLALAWLNLDRDKTEGEPSTAAYDPRH